MRKIGLISLGCDKNRVDSELLLGSAVDNDFEIVVDPMQADVLVVNTCAFIESARREAIEAIFDLVNVKNATGAKLVVTGCLAQRYPQEIYNEIPEVDAVIGADRYSQFGKIISGLFDENQPERLLSVRNDLTTIEQGKRVLTTPKHYAYLRIADGCNNFCTYCSIPYIRGRYRSRKIEDVVGEATQLVKDGAKELILVAQDLTDYGIDLFGKRSLVSLLNELCKIEKLDTIRLLYCYPEHVDDELINCIADNPKIAKYIDLPLQHVNDRILKRMNRKTDKKEIIECIKKLRENIFGMTIRSTFICGFPGETEDDVNELAEFLKEQKLNNVGFFEYCR
ncbi:MAG: 30S ribosomal protein S12 methylthiotransferase RimO, partial [Clostridiales bacterium]|nr:30S ribosomal protein S12 methylthiotransferase RimO [Clostridiales bacterium]MDY5726522.1 30S ribosomal protein S12 methylthiotransferase RimO [Eubacteriales bacterium]